MITPPLPQSTQVVLLATSTANDKLVDFNVEITDLSLIDGTGNKVTLYTAPKSPSPALSTIEFMRLNGVAEPLASVSVPGGVYSGASATLGFCQLTAVTVGSVEQVIEATYVQQVCTQQTGKAVVNLASPIHVAGPTMALVLNLDVPQSYTLTTPVGAIPASYSFSPTFALTPVNLATRPTNEQDGKLIAIGAQITSINPVNSTFLATTPAGSSFSIKTDSSTAFQGVAAFSTLAAGTIVSMDLAIQPDSSLLATRIEVDDIAASVSSVGPVIDFASPPGTVVTAPAQGEGCSICSSSFQYNTNTNFGFSSEFTNLQDLPFPPSLSGPGLLFGQNLSVFYSPGSSNQLPIAPTAILAPQIINGTVTGVSMINNFNVYSVALAPYDLIPTLQRVVGPFVNRLSNPNVIQVYTDANTSVLASSPIGQNSVMRFRGLIFDDNGTLRMDCNLIRDGVPE